MKKGLQTVILRPSDPGGANFKPALGRLETAIYVCPILNGYFWQITPCVSYRSKRLFLLIKIDVIVTFGDNWLLERVTFY
jgi:hypothetical protein